MCIRSHLFHADKSAQPHYLLLMCTYKDTALNDKIFVGEHMKDCEPQYTYVGKSQRATLKNERFRYLSYRNPCHPESSVCT